MENVLGTVAVRLIVPLTEPLLVAPSSEPEVALSVGGGTDAVPLAEDEDMTGAPLVMLGTALVARLAEVLEGRLVKSLLLLL